MSDRDIGLLARLGHLLFTLYIRTYVLSFAYTILGVSFSHCQHDEILGQDSRNIREKVPDDFLHT